MSNGSAEVWPGTSWKRTLRRRLLTWYRKHARDLPWRHTSDPYRIWVSEVMLQQTQVAAVIPYFGRFLAAFPDVSALAVADEQQVLRLWEGLGYYRRGRQLHRAARMIVEEHGGQFPSAFEVVRGLPGIGRYTAGAILSIAFDARQPIVEANTARLYARLLAYRGEPASGAGRRLLWAAATELLPARRAGTFNQALMELGSQICVPRSPRCGICPVASLCQAYLAGLQGQIPTVRPRPQVEQVHEAAVVIRRGTKVLLLRRGAQQRWGGLWDFPRFPINAQTPAEAEQELIEKVAALTGLRIVAGPRLATIRHGVTRFRITLHCRQAWWHSGRARHGRPGDARWVLPHALEEYPLSVTGRRIARLLTREAGEAS